MERREYFLERLGVGERWGGPPMSAIRSLPERPGAARWKGGWRRSGQGVMVTETWVKLVVRLDFMMGGSDWRGGGERRVLVKVHWDIFFFSTVL